MLEKIGRMFEKCSIYPSALHLRTLDVVSEVHCVYPKLRFVFIALYPNFDVKSEVKFEALAGRQLPPLPACSSQYCIFQKIVAYILEIKEFTEITELYRKVCCTKLYEVDGFVFRIFQSIGLFKNLAGHLSRTC